MNDLRFSDEEVEAVRAHYGVSALDPALEAELRDDGPEGDGYLDPRRRQRHLLKIWAGRKASKSDVHTSHCCEKHGCKYGDDDCPVAKKVSVQEYLCESCQDDVYALREAFPRAEAYARSVAFRDLDEGNYILVDGEKLRLAKPATAEETKAQFADLVWAIQTAYLAGVV